MGEPFRETSFESLGRLNPDVVTYVEISLTEDRLVLPIKEVFGSIWMLEDVDR